MLPSLSEVQAAVLDHHPPFVGPIVPTSSIKVAGDFMYLFYSMDNDTRYWLASDLANCKEGHDAAKLFKDTPEQTGKISYKVITDDLNSY